MQHILKASVLVVFISLFFSMDAPAADSAPTVSDAHEYIGELVGSGLVHNYDYKIFDYRGNGCTSSLHYGSSHTTIDIDWTLITYVNQITAIAKGQIGGRIIRSFDTGEKFTDASFALRTEESVAMARLVKAMTLLMNSCAKKSKFD